MNKFVTLVLLAIGTMLLVACGEQDGQGQVLPPQPSVHAATKDIAVLECTWHSSAGVSVVIIRNGKDEVVGGFGIEDSICSSLDFVGYREVVRLSEVEPR